VIGWQATSEPGCGGGFTRARSHSTDERNLGHPFERTLYWRAIEFRGLQWGGVPFDLILDSGCLHSLVGGTVASYKQRVLDWLAPGGDYLLEHWGKRHALDWRPVGPTDARRPRLRGSSRRIWSSSEQTSPISLHRSHSVQPFAASATGSAEDEAVLEHTPPEAAGMM
jgi:hypothetical protein